MSRWEIRYYCDKQGSTFVSAWLDKLTRDQLKSIAKELKLLSLCGNQLRLPHSRSLGKGLFELRERRYGLRIYYVFQPKKVIYLS